MSEWSEDEIVLVSAIEHYSYCPRQCALIHIEHVFDENIFTLRGRRAHERVDEVDSVEEEGARVERALPIWSRRLGLQGKADIVEFRAGGIIYPIEYKYGRRRHKVHDDLQLCAQALCLEEMLGVTIARGALYYYSSRRRREAQFDDQLRAKTEEIIAHIRRMQIMGEMPPPVDDARCRNCSLADACMPSALRALPRLSIQAALFKPLCEEDIVWPENS